MWSSETVERAVRRRSWGLSAELIITIPVLLLLGSFLAANIDEPRFFVPALLLQLFASVQLALHIHYYRVDKVRSRGGGGTGLGQPIIRYIAEGHGGRVTVDSVEGEGTTFVVELPLAPSVAPQ